MVPKQAALRPRGARAGCRLEEWRGSEERRKKITMESSWTKEKRGRKKDRKKREIIFVNHFYFI